MTAALQAAIAAHKAGSLDEAEVGYREALIGGPNANAAHNLGLVCAALWRHEEAIEWFAAAHRLKPDNFAILLGMGGSLLRLQRPIDAERVLRQARALRSDWTVDYRLGCALLMQGRYTEGWPGYEARMARAGALARFGSLREWRGEPLKGRSIRVWGEQGLGDEIQAARFIRLLKDQGAAHVTFACAKANIRAFGDLGADSVVDRDLVEPSSPNDYWTMLWSIPGRLGIAAENLPGTPYLFSDQMGAGPRVGTVWRGNPANSNDTRRSMPSNLLGGLPGAVELEPTGDTLDSLVTLNGLDLLITVDTSWAHMAGALGKPCWLLLSRSGVDWRWGIAPTPTTPWYDSMRLYWQSVDGVWDDVIADVQRDLATFTAAR